MTSLVIRPPNGRPVAAGAARAAATSIGGLALLCSTFLPWTASGLGSSQAGHELADLVVSGTVAAWVDRWTGVVLYAVPLAGALLLGTATVAGRGARWCRRAALAGGSALTAAVLVALSAPVGRWGAGAWAAVGGLAVPATVAVVEAVARRHRTRRRSGVL